MFIKLASGVIKSGSSSVLSTLLFLYLRYTYGKRFGQMTFKVCSFGPKSLKAFLTKNLQFRICPNWFLVKTGLDRFSNKTAATPLWPYLTFHLKRLPTFIHLEIEQITISYLNQTKKMEHTDWLTLCSRESGIRVTCDREKMNWKTSRSYLLKWIFRASVWTGIKDVKHFSCIFSIQKVTQGEEACWICPHGK